MNQRHSVSSLRVGADYDMRTSSYAMSEDILVSFARNRDSITPRNLFLCAHNTVLTISKFVERMSIMRNSTNRSLLIATVAMSVSVLCCSHSQTITWLGNPPGGSNSNARDVSFDGTVVAGTYTDSNGQQRAFRWTSTNGMQDIGTLGGNSAVVYGLSANGQYIVGESKRADGQSRAFIWRPNLMSQIPQPETTGNYSCAGDVSLDGHVVVGHYRDPVSNRMRAFRYEVLNNQFVTLPILDPFYSHYGWGVSPAGNFVAGLANDNAVRWTYTSNGSFIQDLGLPPNRTRAVGQRVNNSGTVVGWADSPATAFRYTQSGGMQLLSTPTGGISFAYDVSEQNIVVGWVAAPLARAARWDANGVLDNLNQTYAAILCNSVLIHANGISPDGRYIVGWGSHNGVAQAFLLDTQGTPPGGGSDIDGNGCVDDADLLAVLFAFGSTSNPCSPLPEDVDGNGIVDDADLLAVLFDFGTGC